MIFWDQVKYYRILCSSRINSLKRESLAIMASA